MTAHYALQPRLDTPSQRLWRRLSSGSGSVLIVATLLVLVTLKHDLKTQHAAYWPVKMNLLPIPPDTEASDDQTQPHAGQAGEAPLHEPVPDRTAPTVEVTKPAQSIPVPTLLVAAAPPKVVSFAPASAPTPLRSSERANRAKVVSDAAPRADSSGTASSNREDGGGDNPTADSIDLSNMTDADWVREPRADELTRYYPTRARRQGISGAATLACQVKPDRHVHNCRVLSETPEGYGFGTAMVAASAQFRVYPPTTDGVALRHTWVRIHIGWVENHAPPGMWTTGRR